VTEGNQMVAAQDPDRTSTPKEIPAMLDDLAAPAFQTISRVRAVLCVRHVDHHDRKHLPNGCWRKQSNLGALPSAWLPLSTTTHHGWSASLTAA
jgi:hypothetical protein